MARTARPIAVRSNISFHKGLLLFCEEIKILIRPKGSVLESDEVLLCPTTRGHSLLETAFPLPLRIRPVTLNAPDRRSEQEVSRNLPVCEARRRLPRRRIGPSPGQRPLPASDAQSMKVFVAFGKALPAVQDIFRVLPVSMRAGQSHTNSAGASTSLRVHSVKNVIIPVFIPCGSEWNEDWYDNILN